MTAANWSVYMIAADDGAYYTGVSRGQCKAANGDGDMVRLIGC